MLHAASVHTSDTCVWALPDMKSHLFSFVLTTISLEMILILIYFFFHKIFYRPEHVEC